MPVRDAASGVLELTLRPGVSLVRDPRVHQGKTRGMDKGLFLKAGGRLCAGESAGMALPVLRCGAVTVFPSLAGLSAPDARCVEMTFSMDQTLRWHWGGRAAPLFFTRILERIADGFMKVPAFQQTLLGGRNALFSLFCMSSTMEPADPKGSCRVVCRTSPQGLLVAVDGSGLEGKGTVILLNEVEGRSFSVLKGGEGALEGKAVPAWKRVDFDHCLESPELGLGVSLAPGPGRAPDEFSLFCGREQGRLLDWAGFALTCARPVFSYQVRIERSGEEVRGEHETGYGMP